MPGWEEYKQTVVLVAAFLGLWLLVYLLVLGPNAEEVDRLEVTLESELGKEWETFFDPEEEEQQVRVSVLTHLHQEQNRQLEGRLKELEESLSRPFPSPLIPAENMSKRQSYVRQVLREHSLELREQAGHRNVHLSEEAETLGLNLPLEMVEDLGQDLDWLRQIHVAADVYRLLLKYSEEADETKNLLAIHRLAPQAGGWAGPRPHFFQTFPVRVEVTMNLRGVMRVLWACRESETALVVRALEVDASPEARGALVVTKELARQADGSRVVRKQAEHYYRVRFELSRLVLGDVKAAAVQDAGGEEEKPEVRPTPIVY